jgi:UDP-N-acetyl-D-galactosamine dehydrogenase
VHRAPNIKVAEAAKVIENTQRDLNIALMNELSLIFDRLGIRTQDVLDAASTKWNFLRFAPGLVGGHCIGVDPYYLTAKAEALGYNPNVILAGRRINDAMGALVAQKAISFLQEQDIALTEARVGVFGLTFKENVPDLRNSKVFDIILSLRNAGITPVAHDPMADAAVAMHECQIAISPLHELRELDCAILAVPHAEYLKNRSAILEALNSRGVLIDIKSVFDPRTIPAQIRYWSL